MSNKKRPSKKAGRKKPVKRIIKRKKPARKKIIKKQERLVVSAPQKTYEEPKAIHTHEEKPRAEKPHASSPPSKAPVIKIAIVGLAVAAGLALLGFFYVNMKKCGEATAVFTSASYENEKAQLAREGKPAKTQDQTARHIGIIKEEAARSGLKKAEKDYFAGHFTAVISSAVQPRKNDIALGVVYAEKTAKLGWFRSRACAGSKSRMWLTSRPQQDKKKIDVFVSAANTFIPDQKIRGEVIEYYTGPEVALDLSADIGPYYLYYMAHAFVFENYPAINGIAPQYPAAIESDAAEFLGLEEMFKIFEEKANALAGLTSLIDTSTGSIKDSAAEKVKKAAVELSAVIEASDSKTAQEFMITALEASLAAWQWAKMENSRHKKPWFETTYDEDLNDAKVKRYLNRLKGSQVSQQERKLIAAAALILYKTSMCMKTFTWSKKYTAYAENYRLAHSIIMHYVNSYDALLCKKIADELDRYYAGRYYGTVNR